MKNKLQIFSLSLLIILMTYALECREDNNPRFVNLALPNEISIKAEIADSDRSRAYGLMNRKTLPENEGMLFIFDEEGFHSFWMKNTLIPLDIIWLDKDFRIVYFYQNVPPCKTDPCRSYAPLLKAKYVLEVNGGLIKTQGLKLDDKLKLIPEL